MNTLYIGEMGDAVNNLIALSKIASKVVMINTELTRLFDKVPGMEQATGENCRVWNLYESVGVFARRIPPKVRKLWRYVRCLFGVRILRFLYQGSKAFSATKYLIEEENIQFVIAAWGTDAIPDIIFLRAVSPNIPIVHYLAAFPTSQTSWLREKIELYLFAMAVRHANGFIAGSDRMKNFLMDRYGLDAGSILVCPIFYTTEYFTKMKLAPLSDIDREPHLVCTGSMSFSYPGNNVFDKIMEIARTKIHVHCMKIENQTIANPYVHFFERFDTPDMVVGKLAAFLTQFDGCLVLYNAPMQRLRYEFSVPQRFLFCFTAGIPIFMPKGIFRSCEDIIQRHQNGLVYKTVEELNAVLRDGKAMNILKENASACSRDFTFEAQAERLLLFFTAMGQSN
jgi:hypothetical protein